MGEERGAAGGAGLRASLRGRGRAGGAGPSKCQCSGDGTGRGFGGAGHKHEGDCHTPQPRQRLEKEGLRLSEGRMQGEIRQGNQEKAMKALAACT